MVSYPQTLDLYISKHPHPS